MKQKPYRAFGYIVIKNTWTDGEPYQPTAKPDETFWNYFTKGSMINNVSISPTTPTYPDFNVGHWHKFETDIDRTVKHTVNGDTVVWCVSSKTNNDYLPDCEKWFLASGEKTDLSVGTKLMFCQGSISFNGQTVSDPTQIKISSDVTQVTANEDSFGIKFV